MKDIDACCKSAGLYPDVLLCGHAHLYQRFTRVMPGGKEVPYIVAGSGGYAATAPKQLPPVPITVGDHTLVVAPIALFGFLTLETDARTIAITFKTGGRHQHHDSRLGGRGPSRRQDIAGGRDNPCCADERRHEEAQRKGRCEAGGKDQKTNRPWQEIKARLRSSSCGEPSRIRAGLPNQSSRSERRLVEPDGIEPTTSSLRTRRSPN